MLDRAVTDPISDRYKEALRRGHVAVVQGRPREAVAHYEEAGRLAGHRPLPWVSMGSVYLSMRRPAEAIAAFDEALRRAPGDVSALRGKAEALAAAGRRDEANAVMRRASELEAMEHAGRRMARGRPPGMPTLSFAEAEEARAVGDDERAIEAYLRGRGRLRSSGTFPTRRSTPATGRSRSRPATIDVHLTMARPLPRSAAGREHGVERVELIEHVLRHRPRPRRPSMRLQDLAGGIPHARPCPRADRLDRPSDGATRWSAGPDRSTRDPPAARA